MPYSDETKRRAEEIATKKLIKDIVRNQKRAEAIIEAIRAGLHRYAHSTRGGKSLGAKCSVTIEHSHIVMTCKDGTVFRIGFK